MGMIGFGLLDFEVTQRLINIKCPSCYSIIPMGERDLDKDKFNLPCGCVAKSKYLVDIIKLRIKGALVK